MRRKSNRTRQRPNAYPTADGGVEKAEHAGDQTTKNAKFRKGDFVMIEGLKAQPHYNGKIAVVVGDNIVPEDRLNVELKYEYVCGTAKSVNLQNLSELTKFDKKIVEIHKELNELGYMISGKKRMSQEEFLGKQNTNEKNVEFTVFEMLGIMEPSTKEEKTLVETKRAEIKSKIKKIRMKILKIIHPDKIESLAKNLNDFKRFCENELVNKEGESVSLEHNLYY